MSTMHDWLDEAKAALGIDLDMDVDALLEMTRVVAHDITRPAAPLTAFLVGYAAAKGGGDAEAVAAANRTVVALAGRLAPQPDES